MTMRHTPAPWRLFHDEGSQRYEIDDGRAGSKPIASVDYGLCEPFDSEQGANARLIAAAPELLQALKLCRAHLPEPDCPVWCDVCSRIDAAIAKAENCKS